MSATTQPGRTTDMAIALHDDAEVEQHEIRTRTTERDEFQKGRDAEMRDLAVKWDKAKRPEPKAKNAPYNRYAVAKADRAEIKQVIRRAARLFCIDTSGALAVRADIPSEKRGLDIVPVFYKDVETKAGRYQVKFTLTTEVPPSKAKGDETEEKKGE